MAQKTTWHNRIVGYGEEPPENLLANPRNWRMHAQHQQAALSGVLQEVGVVQNVICNRTTGHLIDGHLRVTLAMRANQPSIPVTYVELSEAEEALVLATFDPISALAGTDQELLRALLDEVSTGEEAVQQMLSDLAANEGIIPPDFAPVGIDEQGRLDEKAKTVCPECGHVF
jgi:ParB-like chromosome segregation protein Spo0J